MFQTFSILFFLQRSKATKDGMAPVYLRITVNGKRSQISIKRKVEILKWNSGAGKVNGTTQEVKELNRYMDSIKHQIYRIQQRLQDENRHITALIIKDIYQGKEESFKMLLKIFQDHNTQVEKLIGKDFALGTAERYRTAKKHVGDYIKLEYHVDVISVKDVDHKFINGFEYYLKTERNCSHNTSIKYISNFKKIIRIAYAHDWITKDPFSKLIYQLGLLKR